MSSGMAEHLPWGTPRRGGRAHHRAAERAGANMVQISLNRGAMPHEMFIEQIRRFAREVLPALQAHQVEARAGRRGRACLEAFRQQRGGGEAMAMTNKVGAAADSQTFGGLQLRVAVLCGLIQALDGYDLSAIGLAVPSLTKAWSLPPSAFTQAFALSSVGIMVGAMAAGPIADRFGRKPVLLLSVALFGLFSLLSAWAPSLADAGGAALLHRHRHRWRHADDRGAHLRLYTGPLAHLGRHVHVHRQHDRRLLRRPDRRADPADAGAGRASSMSAASCRSSCWSC